MILFIYILTIITHLDFSHTHVTPYDFLSTSHNLSIGPGTRVTRVTRLEELRFLPPWRWRWNVCAERAGGLYLPIPDLRGLRADCGRNPALGMPGFL